MFDRRADTKAFVDLKKKGLRGDGPATLKMKRLSEPLLPPTRRERCDLSRRRFRPLSKNWHEVLSLRVCESAISARPLLRLCTRTWRRRTAGLRIHVGHHSRGAVVRSIVANTYFSRDRRLKAPDTRAGHRWQSVCRRRGSGCVASACGQNLKTAIYLLAEGRWAG